MSQTNWFTVLEFAAITVQRATLMWKSNNELHYITKTVNLFMRVKFSTHPAFTCSKITIGTLEQGVKYVQS